MMVSINIAAGLLPGGKKGAYAFWITSDLGSFKEAGPLAAVDTEDQANLMALAKALEFLNNTNFTDVEKIFVESDAADLFRKISRADAPGTAAARCFMWLKILQKKFYLVYYDFTSVPSGRLKGCALWCDRSVEQIVNPK